MEGELYTKLGAPLSRVTTDSKHSLPVAANLLEQNFVADQPNQVLRHVTTPLVSDNFGPG
jgi:hypothetical protein